MSEIKFRSDMGVALLNHMGTDAEIAEDARTSTKFERSSNPERVGLIRKLIEEGHWSPFEHAILKFGLEVPLFVRDQIVRHKSLSFSVFSLRYSEAEPKFWVPEGVRPLVQVGKAMDYRRSMGSVSQTETALTHAHEAAEECWGLYENMLDHDITPEVARAVLPTSLYTRMVITGNLRSWMHFLDVRADKHAQWEVRDVATQIAEEFANHFPVSYAAWEARNADATA